MVAIWRASSVPWRSSCLSWRGSGAARGLLGRQPAHDSQQYGIPDQLVYRILDWFCILPEVPTAHHRPAPSAQEVLEKFSSSVWGIWY